MDGLQMSISERNQQIKHEVIAIITESSPVVCLSRHGLIINRILCQDVCSLHAKKTQLSYIEQTYSEELLTSPFWDLKTTFCEFSESTMGRDPTVVIWLMLTLGEVTAQIGKN